MKKEYMNIDILTIYDVLKDLSCRSDIVCGDADIYWANTMNLKAFEDKASQIRKVIDDLVNSYFTDKNSHVAKDDNGDDVRVLNEDTKEETLKALNKDIVKIHNKNCKVEIETFSNNALKKMVKVNENKLSFLQIKVLSRFVKEDGSDEE